MTGGHQLGPGQGWMDEGSRGGLIWTAEQQTQYHRYQVRKGFNFNFTLFFIVLHSFLAMFSHSPNTGK